MPVGDDRAPAGPCQRQVMLSRSSTWRAAGRVTQSRRSCDHELSRDAVAVATSMPVCAAHGTTAVLIQPVDVVVVEKPTPSAHTATDPAVTRADPALVGRPWRANHGCGGVSLVCSTSVPTSESANVLHCASQSGRR